MKSKSNQNLNKQESYNIVGTRLSNPRGPLTYLPTHHPSHAHPVLPYLKTFSLSSYPIFQKKEEEKSALQKYCTYIPLKTSDLQVLLIQFTNKVQIPLGREFLALTETENTNNTTTHSLQIQLTRPVNQSINHQLSQLSTTVCGSPQYNPSSMTNCHNCHKQQVKTPQELSALQKGKLGTVQQGALKQYLYFYLLSNFQCQLCINYALRLQMMKRLTYLTLPYTKQTFTSIINMSKSKS